MKNKAQNSTIEDSNTRLVREHSNIQARSTWENKAVGNHRAQATAGTPEYYQQIRAYRYGYETPFIPEFFEFSDLNGKRVLEVGVGNGIDAVEMMKNGARYTGIDITSNHINLTRRYIEIEHTKGHRIDVEGVIEGDLLETNLPGNYDVIYSFGVLHHIAHEFEYLEQLKKMLNENGELRIAVYAKFSFFNLWMAITWIFKNHMKNSFVEWQSHLAEDSNLSTPVVIKIRNRKEILCILENSGFKVVKYARKGFVQRYLPGIGRLLKPNGLILNAMASVMGWYHCFICRIDHK